MIVTSWFVRNSAWEGCGLASYETEPPGRGASQNSRPEQLAAAKLPASRILPTVPWAWRIGFSTLHSRRSCSSTVCGGCLTEGLVEYLLDLPAAGDRDLTRTLGEKVLDCWTTL